VEATTARNLEVTTMIRMIAVKSRTRLLQPNLLPKKVGVSGAPGSREPAPPASVEEQLEQELALTAPADAPNRRKTETACLADSINFVNLTVI